MWRRVPPGEPHQLVFDVSGTATITTLTCTVNGKETTETAVRLPWSRTFGFPAGAGDGPSTQSMNGDFGD